MIKEVRIQSRGSGKTNWAMHTADPRTHFYIDGFNGAGIRRLYTLPHNTSKKLVIDEPFNTEVLSFVLEHLDTFDYYLIGTPIRRIQDISPEFYHLLLSQFPEALI